MGNKDMIEKHLRKYQELCDYVKDKAVSLINIVEHYEKLENEKGYLTTDQQRIYLISQSQLNLINDLIKYILTEDCGETKPKKRTRKRTLGNTLENNEKEEKKNVI